MQHPEIWPNQVRLRYASRYFYNVSLHYKRLCDYYANVATLDYVLEPYGINDPDKIDVDKMRKAYFKVANRVENMNLKHEFRKLLETAYLEDAFFGYIHENNDSFFVQKLDANFCRISSIEDGVYNFAFDFTYFNDYPFRLPMFPQEFQDRMKLYNDAGFRWQELDPEKTICIKINEQNDYPVPPFMGIFQNILDIQDFKDLQRQKTEIGNYKIIVQKIPMQQGTGVDNYAISLKHVAKFHNDIVGSVPEQVGVITTPMDVTVEDFERDESDVNKAYEQTANFWNDSGVSNLLFSSGAGSSGSIALGSSVKTDESTVFAVLRQLERWVNRYLKVSGNQKYKFRLRFLNNTIFNKQEELTNYNNLATMGFPVKTSIASTIGLSPTSVSLQAIFENDVLQIHENMIPVANSYTQSGEDQGGRPQKDTGDLTEEGAKTRDSLKNTDKRPKK